MATDKSPTEKQISYLQRLAKLNGFIVNVETLTRQQASSVIDCLYHRNWDEPKMWSVRPLLRRR